MNGEIRKAGPPSAVPWNRLKAWIAEKEEEERMHNRPAKLHQREIAAIDALIQLITEPDVSDKDYVSQLTMYTQAHKLPPPKYEDDGPVQVNMNGLPAIRWRCYSSLSSLEGRFPCEGYGFDEHGDPPLFRDKKTAKQFAAKQVMERIKQPRRRSQSPRGRSYRSAEHFNGDVPSNSRSSSRTRSPQRAYKTPSPPLVKKVRVENSKGNKPHTTNTSMGPPEIPASRASAASSSYEAPLLTAADNVILAKVIQLSNKLGFDAPAYELIPEDSTLPCLFRGRAVFKLGSRVPDGLGQVHGVAGKAQAKLAVAKKVLKWLEKEDQAREDTISNLISDVLTRDK